VVHSWAAYVVVRSAGSDVVADVVGSQELEERRACKVKVIQSVRECGRKKDGEESWERVRE
jgi:hypothetical protein